MFYFGDGDSVGALISSHVMRGDMASASYVSRSISAAVSILAVELKSVPGIKLWYAGGDDIALEAEESPEVSAALERASQLFFEIVGTTFSWGQGKTPLAAKQALALAKLEKSRPQSAKKRAQKVKAKYLKVGGGARH